MIFKKGYTGVKVLVTNHLETTSIKKVYDIGNGAFVYSYMGRQPRYMAKHGDFESYYHSCNADAVSWRPHSGDALELDLCERGESIKTYQDIKGAY